MNKPQSGGLDMTGIWLGILGAALFSTKPILIKLVYEDNIAPTVVMTLRMAFSMPFYLLAGWFAVRDRQRKGIKTDFSAKTLATTALIGVAGYYVASYLDLEGLTRITAQFERLILFTYPIFVALFAWIFLNTPLTRTTLVCLALTYAGLAVIFVSDFKTFGPDVVTGSLLVFGAALVFAGYVTFSKPYITRLGSRIFTSLAISIASIAIFIHFLAIEDFASLAVPVRVYVVIAIIAVFATVVPSFLIGEAIGRLGPGPTSIIGSVGPVFTSIMAIWILGEAFTLPHLAGTILIITGIALLARSSRRAVNPDGGTAVPVQRNQ